MTLVKDDMFGYVAASPDKSYLIAVGLRYELSRTITHGRSVIDYDSCSMTFRFSPLD